MRKLMLLLALVAPAVAQSLTGFWSANLNVNGVSIPFRVGLSADGSDVKGWFFNGDDKVNSTSGTLRDGKLVLTFDQYASKLEATYKDGALNGSYGRQGKAPYAFTAKLIPDISGNWEIAVKSPKGESAWHFIVRQNGSEATAT